jgi:CheY-like chemotaxis protein
VEEAFDLVAVAAAKKQLELICQIEPDTPLSVVGDATRLRQILVNLLANAVKFTDSGEVVVTVAATESVAAGLSDVLGYKLHFTVRDTGIGIPADKMHRLFQSFSQVDTSTTRKYGGTGLGLVISHRLCRLMGGEMWAESEGVPGAGTIFHFTVEMGREANPTDLPLDYNLADLKGKSVLIVDDNESNRFVLTRQLENWGMEVQAATSGPKALLLLRQPKRFDVALLDMSMPDMDGVQLARAIHRLDAWRDLPLILLTSIGTTAVTGAMTGATVEADQSSAMQRDDTLFATILTKPSKSAHLCEALCRILGKQQMVTSKVPDHLEVGPHVALQRPLRILLAEDNVVNQKVALLILKKLGYEADVAADGLEVLDALHRQPYDLILMDIQMPEMDGLETTRHIRRSKTLAQQPRIVAMTANAMQGDRAQYLAAGMDDYVSKPMRIQDLMAVLSGDSTKSPT